MEALQRMKSVGAFMKRRGSLVSNVNLVPEPAKSPESDIHKQVYDLKRSLEEKDVELKESQECLRDYISNRINISRDLSIDDQITRLQMELKKLGVGPPKPTIVKPVISMEEYTSLQAELMRKKHDYQKQERYYESRIQSIKTKDAEEKASLKLEIFELRDQCQALKDKQKAGSSVSATPPDMRLVIQLSEQVVELSAELDEANAILARYEKEARDGRLGQAVTDSFL